MLSPVTVTASNKGLDIYRASRTRVWDIIYTRVKLGFALAEKTATGEEWVQVHPYRYAADTLELDAKGMQIFSVDMDNTPVPYTYANDTLKLRFKKIYTAADTLQLHIKYKAMPYAEPTGGSAAITEDRGLYFINTDNEVPGKPVEVWTQGETESNSRWLPTIDAPNERFTTQIELTVPDTFITLSNGYLTGHINTGNGLRTDIWRMDKPIQTYAIMFATGKFAVVKDEWKRKEISYYVEPEYEPYARIMFKHTPEMVDYYSTTTGVPYPWNKYAQIVVRDYVSGAMENTSATLLGEFMNQNARENADKDYEDVVSHELFHQWFGDYVTAESWSNITLNESFATYGEILWRRYKYGKAAADQLTYESLQTYLSQAKANDPALVRYHYADKEEVFDRISYQKGGVILNYLEGLAGEAAFDTAMKLYLAKNALQPAEAANWRMAVEQATGQDWHWFFDQWYYRGGHPVLDVKYTYDDDARNVTVTVTQKQDELYTLPLKAEVIYGNGKKETDWNITDRRQTFTYAYEGNVKPVVVPDSRHWLPGQLNDNKEPWQWRIELDNSKDNILNKFYAIDNVSKKTDDSSAQSIFESALTDKDAAVRVFALERLQQQKTARVQNRWESRVGYVLATDGNNKVRAAALDVLAAWKIKAYKDEKYKALADSSYAVAGAALAAINATDKDTAYILAKQMLQNDPKADLQQTIWDIIAEKADAADAPLFSKEAPYFYGAKKISFAYSAAAYLASVYNIDAFKQVLDAYEKLITREGIKSYRMAMAGPLLQTAADYKERLRGAHTNAEKDNVQEKLDLMKRALQNIMSKEKETDNLKKYREVMNAVYR